MVKRKTASQSPSSIAVKAAKLRGAAGLPYRTAKLRRVTKVGVPAPALGKK